MITRRPPSISFRLRSSRSFSVSLRPSTMPGSYPARLVGDLRLQRVGGLLEAGGIAAERVERPFHRGRVVVVRRPLEAADVVRVTVQLLDEVVVLGPGGGRRIELL